MPRMICAMGVFLVFCGATRAQKPPLLAEDDIAALGNELSGETARQNLEGIARFHRQRGSAGFHSAAELVADRLRAYGLSDVRILQFPADGKIFYGTQRSRPAWDAEFAELWEMYPAVPAEQEKVRSRGYCRRRSRLPATGPNPWPSPRTASRPMSRQIWLMWVEAARTATMPEKT